MSEYKPIPARVAQQICRDFDKSMVVIMAYDPSFEKTHTTTFGVSAFDKENAAAVGELCAKAIGCDLSRKQQYEDFHRDYDPALFKESIDLLLLIRSRQGCTPQMVQQAERILSATGHGIRRG